MLAAPEIGEVVVDRKRETIGRNYPNLAFGCCSPLEIILITPISTQRSFDIEKDTLSARFATRFDTRVSSRHHWEAENEISNSLEMAFSL